MFRTRTGAAGLSILSNSLLILLKVVVGLLSGSIAIMAEAIHSGIDLVAAAIAYFSLRIAGKPADWEHPYGHGKIDNVSGTVESALIFVAAIFIAYGAIGRLLKGAEVQYLTLGIVVMGVSTVANIIVSRYLLRIARETDSLALEADARHLTADVYTSLGVFVGLIVVQVTGINILDPIIALVVLLFIFRTAYDVLKRSFGGLVDVRLPKEEEDLVSAAIIEHGKELVGFHELRTRKAGRERHIDLHLVLARNINIEQAHHLADHLENDIKSKLPHSVVNIHIEPCEVGCERCSIASCPWLPKA